MSKANFKIEFKMGPHEANTLKPEYIGRHQNGWKVDGEIHDDWYKWVNHFEARKGRMWVKGDFEKIVYASSKKAYEEFIKYFPPEYWDYWDI